jgi:hypothetical protein
VRFLSDAWRPGQPGRQPFAVTYQHVTKENLTRQSEEVRDQLPHKKMLPEGSLRRKRMKTRGEYISELLLHGFS